MNLSKQVFYTIVAIFSFLTACKKDGVSTVPLNEQLSSSATPVTAPGTFISANNYTVTGTARVYRQDNKLVLSLDNFNSSSGPDLRVYLSKETTPVNFISLGKLKSVTGNQLYEIPGATDLNAFNNVIIHCQQFNRVFGYTTLK